MNNFKLSTKIILSVICLTLYVLISILIVHYSLENGEESIATSDGVTEVIEETIETITSNNTKVNRETISKYVREVIGHFGLFALSSFLGFLGFIFIFKKQYLNALLISLIGINLAIVTEIIQSRVDGRVFDIKDILINISGVFFGIVVSKLLFMGIIGILKKKNASNICQ